LSESVDNVEFVEVSYRSPRKDISACIFAPNQAFQMTTLTNIFNLLPTAFAYNTYISLVLISGDPCGGTLNTRTNTK
jgi:hypothetical protein